MPGIVEWIDWHQEDASTRFSERGVITIENVLIDHYGKTIEDVEYFTNARIMNHVHGKTDAQGNPRAYVGGLKMNRKVIWKGTEQLISEVAASIPITDRKEIRRGDTRQWYFTATLKIPEDHRRSEPGVHDLRSATGPHRETAERQEARRKARQDQDRVTVDAGGARVP